MNGKKREGTVTPEEAKKILEISDVEEKRIIRKNYRRLMRKYHPDGLREHGPEHLQRVRKLIEAYHLLMHEKKDKVESGRQKAKWNWSGQVNEKAFCERNIYLFYSLEVEEAPYYQVAKGKYFWDPEEEEFPLFLLSLRHVSKELLEQVEEEQGYLHQEFLFKEKHFRTQAMLISLLAQQFLKPLAVLEKMVIPAWVDESGRVVYRFRAWISGKGQRIPRKGEVLYPAGFQGNQILVKSREGAPLGQLSFDEDYLYFCTIPLLKKKQAQVKMRVRDVRKEGKTEVEFYFRPEKTGKEENCEELNEEIRSVLTRYGAELRSMRER